MLNPLTAFAARLQSWFNSIGGTSIYGRTLNWEDLPAIPVVNVGYAGSTSTGKPKIWPVSNENGYQPTLGFFREPNGTLLAVELAAGGTAVGSAGTEYHGSVLKPAASTLTIGAVTVPATTNDVTFTVRWRGQTTFTAGVASCWLFYSDTRSTSYTITSR